MNEEKTLASSLDWLLLQVRKTTAFGGLNVITHLRWPVHGLSFLSKVRLRYANAIINFQ